MRYLDSDIILVATMPVSGGLLTPSLTNVRTPINSSDKLSNTNESTPINPAVAARSIIRTLEAHYLMLRQMRTCTADFTYLRMVRRSHSTTTRGFFTSVCRDQSWHFRHSMLDLSLTAISNTNKGRTLWILVFITALTVWALHLLSTVWCIQTAKHSEEEVTQLAEDFQLLVKASNSWRYSFTQLPMKRKLWKTFRFRLSDR